jgi:hypothetical protein
MATPSELTIVDSNEAILASLKHAQSTGINLESGSKANFGILARTKQDSPNAKPPRGTDTDAISPQRKQKAGNSVKRHPLSKEISFNVPWSKQCRPRHSTDAGKQTLSREHE